MEDGVSTTGMWGRVRRWVEDRRAVGMRQTRHQAKVTEMTDVLAGNDQRQRSTRCCLTRMLKTIRGEGRNLAERFGRSLPDSIVAGFGYRSANGSSTVRNGALAGANAAPGAKCGARRWWESAMRARCKPASFRCWSSCWMPTRLSVQVHPDDAYGLANEGR